MYNIDKEKCMNNQVDNENNANDDIDDETVNEASAPLTNTILDEQNININSISLTYAPG